MTMSATATTIITLFLAASANAATLTLKPGDYGATGLPCDTLPNAAVISFDGRNFSYPHASGCTDTVTQRAKGILTIAETCRAAGDGSPVKPDTQTFRLRQLGAARFTLIKGRMTTTYRRCGSIGYFNAH